MKLIVTLWRVSVKRGFHPTQRAQPTQRNKRNWRKTTNAADE